MWKSSVDLVVKVSEGLGKTVRLEDVKANYGNKAMHLIRIHGAEQADGSYDISAIISGANTEQPAATKPNPVVMEKKMENALMNLIPAKDKNYVPWGCYPVVRKVISTNKFAPIFVSGPSGNGKTMGVAQACAVEGRELIVMNITNETTADELIGTWALVDGNTVWKDGPVLTAMRRGAVLCLDEIDQATSKILCIQTIMQDHAYYNPKTGETVTSKPGFTIVGTANTKGNGEGSDRFIGAMPLNEAFLERFPIIIEQDWPTEAVEKKILKKHLSDEAMIGRLVKWAGVTRAAFDDGAINGCIATRRLVQICNNIDIFGKEVEAIGYAVARFNKEDAASMVEVYQKLMKDPNADPVATPEPEQEEDEIVDPFD